MRKFRKVSKAVLSIFLIFLCTSCAHEAEQYQEESRSGLQMSSVGREPLFDAPSYSSNILMEIEPQKVNVEKVVSGWRYVEINGQKGYLPPEGVNYNESADAQIIDIPVTGQFPEYKNGCEALAIKMMMEPFGIYKSKDEIAAEIPKDREDAEFDEDGNIMVWGDPDKGFVGSIEGKEKIGFSIYPTAVVEYLKKYFEKPVNLTGASPEVLERYIRAGHPVVIWATVDFQDAEEGVTWLTDEGREITGTFSVHAMTLVGFDSENYYLNDPFTETKDYQVAKDVFCDIWTQIGNMAVSVD